MTDAMDSWQLGTLRWARPHQRRWLKTHTHTHTQASESVRTAVPQPVSNNLSTADIHPAQRSRSAGRRWFQSAEYHISLRWAALDHFKRGTSTSIHFRPRGSERWGPTRGSFSRFPEPTKANTVNYVCCQKQRWFPLVRVKVCYCCDAFPWPQSVMEARCTVACAAAIK